MQQPDEAQEWARKRNPRICTTMLGLCKVDVYFWKFLESIDNASRGWTCEDAKLGKWCNARCFSLWWPSRACCGVDKKRPVANNRICIEISKKSLLEFVLVYTNDLIVQQQAKWKREYCMYPPLFCFASSLFWCLHDSICRSSSFLFLPSFWRSCCTTRRRLRVPRLGK